MMAAFIIAIRGTVFQAVLLGLAAAFSHTVVIWVLAAAALHYGSHWNAETTELYFQIASAVMIVGLAGWMAWRTRRDILAEAAHDHSHDDHAHGPQGGIPINTGHGVVEITVFEDGVPPIFRLFFYHHGKAAKLPPADNVTIETIRSDGSKQLFTFLDKAGFLESTAAIPEPHEFDVILTLAHGDHSHQYYTQFVEGDHGHDHSRHTHQGVATEFQDAHELSHAADIEKWFAGRTVTTWQVILFGLTGGLLPCPAAFTILIICLQLKKFSLGISMVLAFSVGLAITLVTVGALVAWGMKHAEKRVKGFGRIARKLPYFSGALLTLIGLYIGFEGWMHLHSGQ